MPTQALQNYRRVQVTRRDGPTATVVADRPRTVRARGDELRVETRPVQRNVRVVNDLAGVAAALTDRLQAVIQDGGRTALAAPTTTGTSTAYLLRTAGAPILTLYDGLGVWLTPHTNSDAPPITLKVDSTPVKPILVATATGTIQPYDDALRQGVPTLLHYSSSADAWILGADLSELSLNDKQNILQGISENTTQVESALTEAQAAHDAADQALIDAKTYADAEVAKADQKAQDALDAADQFLLDAKTYADIEIDAATTNLKAEIEDPNGSSLGATLQNEYITAAGADQAIAQAASDLRAEIEDPAGSSIGATLQNEYVTYAQSNSAISAATTALKSEIEDPAGTSLGATLANNYRTLTETDQVIAQAKSDLRAEIEDPTGTSLGATLEQDYLTATETDQAIAQAKSDLRAEIEDPAGTSLGATLEQDYLTATETDSAISAATSSLEATFTSGPIQELRDGLSEQQNDSAVALAANRVHIEGENLLRAHTDTTIRATLEQDYYTVAEADQAISSAKDTLKAEIEDPFGNSLGAEVETQKTALADVQGNLTGVVSFRAQAGGEVSVLDLVALDGAGGSYSLARIAGDYIRLDGQTEVAGDFLVTGQNIVLDGDTSVTGDFEVGSANIADAAITSAKIGSVIESTNYSSGSSGWRIEKSGAAEFNGVVISRQLEVATGTQYVGHLGTNSGNSFQKSDEVWINTGQPTSAWTGTTETYMALVGREGSDGTIYAYDSEINNNPNLITWGFSAEVVPMTSWFSPHELWIRVKFYTRNITDATGFRLRWRLIKVT